MRLTKEQIDNVICNIENAGHLNVRFDDKNRRFVFIADEYFKCRTETLVGISEFSVQPTLYAKRKQPSEELSSHVFIQNWFILA